MKKEEKKYYCRFCKNEIEKGIKICPFCGKSLKKNILLKLFIVLFTILLFVYLQLVVFRNFSYSLKSVVTLNNTEYSVLSVNRTKGDTKWIGSPKEDNIFVIVTLFIKNMNSIPYNYNQDVFTVIDSNNEEYKSIHYDSINLDTVKNTEITYKDSKVLVFEVPVNEEKLKLIYNENNNVFRIKLY